MFICIFTHNQFPHNTFQLSLLILFEFSLFFSSLMPSYGTLGAAEQLAETSSCPLWKKILQN